MYVSPINYINQRRLESAQVLLVTTDLNFKQIAERIGFYDASVFSRMFKSKIGYSPKEYRLMNR
jgi:transcriptional regulator GlxA family with amidase domain